MTGSRTIGGGTTISAGYTFPVGLDGNGTLVVNGGAGTPTAAYGVFAKFSGDVVSNNSTGRIFAAASFVSGGTTTGAGVPCGAKNAFQNTIS